MGAYQADQAALLRDKKKNLRRKLMRTRKNQKEKNKEKENEQKKKKKKRNKPRHNALSPRVRR